jgi:hypothetical protein
MSVHNPRGDGNFARNFRRKMHERKARQGRGGKPMTIFRVRNRFKPPKNDAAWVRLIRGNYTGFDGSNQPFFEYFEHFNATVYRGTICSRTWKEDENGEMEYSGKCIPCHLLDDGADNISHRRMAAFLLLHLDWYYLIPATDDKGNVMKYRRDTKFHKAGDVIYDRIHEEAAIKEHGKVKVKKFEKVFGNLMHWSMGTNHLLVLSAKIDDLETECKCGGRLDVAIWECPECENEIFDMTDENLDYTRKEIQEITMSPYRCPHCEREVMLAPVHECDSCKDPTPLQLWDVDLLVGREGDDTQSQLIVRRHKATEIDERCADLVPDRDILHRVFAGDTLEYQAKTMKVPNPFKSGEARDHVQDYDGDTDEAEDDDIPV